MLYRDALWLKAERTARVLEHSDGPNPHRECSRVKAADISAALRSLVKYLDALLTAGDQRVAGGFGVSAFSLGGRS